MVLVFLYNDAYRCDAMKSPNKVKVDFLCSEIVDLWIFGSLDLRGVDLREGSMLYDELYEIK